MTPRIPTIRRTSAAGRSLVLRGLLLLAAWNGPLPWCHCHGTLATSAASPWLVQHLRSHHAAVSPVANLLFGWHFHVDFPPSENDEAGRPTRPMSQRLVAPSAAEQLGEWIARPASGMPIVAGIETFDGSLVLAAAAAQQPTSFFAGFAPELALPMRLGVARC